MAVNPHKWFKKRNHEDDDFDVVVDVVDVVDKEEPDIMETEPQSVLEKDDWKVKTLDEILQEKRRRLEPRATEKDEERLSPRISSKGSSPLSRIESKSSSKRGSPTAEVIYQLSPVHSSPSSNCSGTRRKHDEDELQKVSAQRPWKGPDEEEGEILSDISDSEGNIGKQRRKSIRSVSTEDIEMVEEYQKPKSQEDIFLAEEQEKSSQESSEEESESSSEVDEEGAVEKQEDKEGESEEESSESESDSGSEDTSAEEGMQSTAKKESISKVEDQTSDEADSEEDSDEDGDSEESESETSEDDEVKQQEKITKGAIAEENDEENEAEDIHKEILNITNTQRLKDRKQRKEDKKDSKVREYGHFSDTEQRYKSSRDKELLDVDGKHKHRRHSREEREQLQQYREQYRDSRKGRDERSGDRERRGKDTQDKTSKGSKGNISSSEEYKMDDSQLIAKGNAERSSSRLEKSDVENKSVNSRGKTDKPGSSRGKNSKPVPLDSGTKRTENPKGKEKVENPGTDQLSGKDKNKRSSSKEQSSELSDLSRHRSRSGDKESNRDKKKEKETSKQKTSRDPTQKGTKDRDKKDSGSKAGQEKKYSKAAPEPSKHKKEQLMSLVLTEQERMQFAPEVVESEASSGEETHQPSNVLYQEMKQTEKEEKTEVEEKAPQLPVYMPAIQGCRNVEEFQWLNRIEEGTYGIVYRAKDRKTNEIVALKRLKMEKEKEGFPITSLREINTLLKSQHPNIVTVREIVVGSNMDRIYIVMDYIEHDLKTLMEHMTSPFTVGEVKTLLIQLLRAVAHLHDNWILHRDIKTSNLLLNNRGILKVGDFGLAREYGSPLRHYTPVVVTLWYRAPELLLGIKEYSCPIDLWSVGCVFAELLTMKALFPGRSEIDEINRIFKELGTPSDKIWPGPPSYSELPHVKKMTFTEYPYNQLRNNFGAYLTDKGFDLLNRFLTYDPKKRITAEAALKHEYFNESPLPVDPTMFPTWPAKSEMQKRPRRKDCQHSPEAPEGGEMFSKLKDEGDSGGSSGLGFHMPTSKKGSAAVPGFSLKF